MCCGVQPAAGHGPPVQLTPQLETLLAKFLWWSTGYCCHLWLHRPFLASNLHCLPDPSMWLAPLRLGAFAVNVRPTRFVRSFAKTAGGGKGRTKRTSAPSASVNNPSTVSNQSGGADRRKRGGAGPKSSTLREKPVPWLLFGVGGQ